VQVPGIPLVLRPRLEAGDAASLVVGVKAQMQANGVVDAADETYAGVGLFFHDAASLCRLHYSYSIDAGSGQTSPLLCPGHIASWERALLWAGSCV
jgi:hypothetical protein